MPAWGYLKDVELAGVMTYIRGEWGNQAGEVTPARVAEIREATRGFSGPWTAELLDAVAEDGP